MIHTNFWLVAGAAAPVIALANIVSLTDVLGARSIPIELFELMRTQSSEDVKAWMDFAAKRSYTVLNVAYYVGYLNGGLQLVILSLALGSLAAGHDLTPLLIPLIAAPAGLVLLYVTSNLNVRARRFERGVKKYRHTRGPSN